MINEWQSDWYIYIYIYIYISHTHNLYIGVAPLRGIILVPTLANCPFNLKHFLRWIYYIISSSLINSHLKEHTGDMYLGGHSLSWKPLDCDACSLFNISLRFDRSQFIIYCTHSVLLPDFTGLVRLYHGCRYSISQEICTRFCFAVLCCGFTLTDFPISIRLTSLALWQSNDCPSASKATLMNMDKYFMWIHYERLHNHNKAKHSKPCA